MAERRVGGVMWGMMGESQCVLGSVGHPVRRRIHATTVAGFPTLRHSQARGREPRPRWSLAHLGCPYTRPLPEDEEGGGQEALRAVDMLERGAGVFAVAELWQVSA